MTELPLWNPAAPPVPHLEVDHLEAFLRAAGLGDAVAVFEGALGKPIPDDPGPYLLFTLLPGIGPTTAGAMEIVSWQTRTVGPALEPADASDLARRVDHAFVGRHDAPITFGGLHVTGIWRNGGPQHLPVPDDDRTHLVCTYFCEIESYG